MPLDRLEEPAPAGGPRRPDGREDAAARGVQLLVARTARAQRELLDAVAAERRMRVAVDEPRDRAAAVPSSSRSRSRSGPKLRLRKAPPPCRHGRARRRPRHCRRAAPGRLARCASAGCRAARGRGRAAASRVRHGAHRRRKAVLVGGGFRLGVAGVEVTDDAHPGVGRERAHARAVRRHRQCRRRRGPPCRRGSVYAESGSGNGGR